MNLNRAIETERSDVNDSLQLLTTSVFQQPRDSRRFPRFSQVLTSANSAASPGYQPTHRPPFSCLILLGVWYSPKMSSSIRNSLHRRNHKERSQLAHRTRLGILEKHKDYVLRARDYHSKQDRITRLKQKAADRNKDEFYFSMKRQRTEVSLGVRQGSYCSQCLFSGWCACTR